MLGREDVEYVAMNAEGAAPELHFVSLILHLRQSLDRVALRQPIALMKVKDHVVVFRRVADAVDRRNGGDDDAILPLQNRLGCRKAHLFDVLVDRRILLDV